MTPRENLIKTIKGENTGKVPVDIDFNFNAVKKYSDQFKGNYQEFFHLGHRRLALTYNYFNNASFRKYFYSLPEGAVINDWGIATYYKDESEIVFSPMKKFETLEQFTEYPFPDYSGKSFYESIREKTQKYHEEGLAVIGAYNGKYIICPAHHISEDVPWDNVMAFYEASQRVFL